MASDRKLKRSSNFTPLESEKLIELVKNHREVLLNKRTDAASVRDREACWPVIAEAFNNPQISAYRDAKQLRIRLDNLRRVARKEISLWVKATRGTRELSETAKLFFNEMPVSMVGHSGLNLDDDAGDENPIEDSLEIVSPQPCRSSRPSKVTSSRLPHLTHPRTSPPSPSNKPSASSHMPSFSDSHSALPKHSSVPSTSDSPEIITVPVSPAYFLQPTRRPLKRPASVASKPLPSTEPRKGDSSTGAFLSRPISQELHHRKINPTCASESQASTKRILVKNDTTNFAEWSQKGGILKLKKEVVPHIFGCQDRLSTTRLIIPITKCLSMEKLNKCIRAEKLRHLAGLDNGAVKVNDKLNAAMRGGRQCADRGAVRDVTQIMQHTDPLSIEKQPSVSCVPLEHLQSQAAEAEYSQMEIKQEEEETLDPATEDEDIVNCGTEEGASLNPVTKDGEIVNYVTEEGKILSPITKNGEIVNFVTEEGDFLNPTEDGDIIYAVTENEVTLYLEDGGIKNSKEEKKLNPVSKEAALRNQKRGIVNPVSKEAEMQNRKGEIVNPVSKETEMQNRKGEIVNPVSKEAEMQNRKGEIVNPVSKEAEMEILNPATEEVTMDCDDVEIDLETLIKYWVAKLIKSNPTQRLYAIEIINAVLCKAETGTLTLSEAQYFTNAASSCLTSDVCVENVRDDYAWEPDSNSETEDLDKDTQSKCQMSLKVNSVQALNPETENSKEDDTTEMIVDDDGESETLNEASQHKRVVSVSGVGDNHRLDVKNSTKYPRTRSRTKEPLKLTRLSHIVHRIADSQTKVMVHNLHDYLGNEYPLWNHHKVTMEVCKATGLRISTILSVLHERRKSLNLATQRGKKEMNNDAG